MTDLFSDGNVWDAAWDSAAQKIHALAALKGTLGDSAQALLQATDRISKSCKQLVRIYIYASLLADEDTGDAENTEHREFAENSYTDIGAATSWFNPELLALGEGTVRFFLTAEPGLAVHAFNLEQAFRKGPHKLSKESENLLPKTGTLIGTPNTVYSVLANANLPRPTVTLSDGNPLRLSQSGYSIGRRARAREDSKVIFDTFWGV
ncbi:MAG: hypothetical protein ACJ04O_12760 [Cellvibrionales bacterium]